MQALAKPSRSFDARANTSAQSLTTRLSGTYDHSAHPSATKGRELVPNAQDLEGMDEFSGESSSNFEESHGAPQSSDHKTSLRRGPWSAEEDDLLRLYVQVTLPALSR